MFVVVVVLAVSVVAFRLPALTWLNNAYDELIGRPHAERRASPGYGACAPTHGETSAAESGETALERTVMISVYLAVIVLVIWFFFFAHDSLTG